MDVQLLSIFYYVTLNNMKVRIGTLYRIQIIDYFNKRNINGAVLDIGCHDGIFLKNVEAPLKIGIDVELKNVSDGIYFVQADANYLPFKKETFTQVYLMDVIEHIEDDKKLPLSIYRVLKTSGSFFLTTPSMNIQLFPWFLTNAISKKWGHIYRIGYSYEELKNLFQKYFVLTFYEWDATWWRTFYLGIRLISEISFRLTASIIKLIFTLDAKNTKGLKGYLILEGIKKDA